MTFNLTSEQKNIIRQVMREYLVYGVGSLDECRDIIAKKCKFSLRHAVLIVRHETRKHYA